MGWGTWASRSIAERNKSGREDREIGADGASVRVLVIAAGEDREIAREVRMALDGPVRWSSRTTSRDYGTSGQGIWLLSP